MKIELYNADCLLKMKDIPDKSVDMVLADLPYQTTACKWDILIPFEPLWAQYKRIIKDNGAIVLTASQPFTSALVMSNPDMFKYELIWHKSIPSGNMCAKTQPMKNHENILIFGTGKTIYNPIMEQRSENTHKTGKGGLYKVKSEHLKNFTAIRKEPNILRYPTSVRSINNVPRHNSLHPTQKPVALFEYLIKTYTNEGDTVLDNVAGSGTTGVACKNLNRNCILIEKDEKYFEIMKQRIENTPDKLL